MKEKKHSGPVLGTPLKNRSQRRAEASVRRSADAQAQLDALRLKMAQGAAAVRILGAVLAKSGGAVTLTAEDLRTAPDVGFAEEDDNGLTVAVAVADPNLDAKPVDVRRLLTILSA